MRTEGEGAVVFASLDEFIDEFEDDDEVLLETDYKGFRLT